MHSVSTLYFKIKLNRFLLSIRSHSTDNATYMFVYNPPSFALICSYLIIYKFSEIARACVFVEFL